MGKFKIQKNLSDADMMKGFVEEETFETAVYKDDDPTQPLRQNKPVASKLSSKEEFYKEFLTEKTEAEIGKLLLGIKMEYLKDGYGDFSIQVRKQGKHILLETAPKEKK